jgi:hypothetical protein
MNKQLLKTQRNLGEKYNLREEQFKIESWPANMARLMTV